MHTMTEAAREINAPTVDPAIHAQHDSDVWAAVSEGRADFLDDRPGYPTDPRMEADWDEFCREYNDRIRREQIEADEEVPFIPSEADERWHAEQAAREVPGFQQIIADVVNELIDHDCPTRNWIGRKVGELFDRARYLEATSPEMFDDRLDAMLDSVYHGVNGAHR